MRLSDKHYAVADCAVRSLGRLVLGVLMARAGSVEGYSVFVLLLGAEVVLTALGNAYYAMPMLTVAPGLEPRERAALERATMQRLLRLVLRAGAVLLGVAAGIAHATDANGWILTWFLAAIGASVLASVARAAAQGRFESKRTVVADALGMALPISAIVLLEPTGAASHQTMWAGLALGQLVSLGMLWPQAASAEVRVSEESRHRVARLGVPMAVGSAINSATTRAQPYLLGSIGGVGAVGAFGVAASLIGPLRLLVTSLASVVRPRLAFARGQGDDAAIGRLMRVTGGLLGGCAAVALLLAWLLGEFAVTHLYGPEFYSAAGLLPIAVLFAALEGFGAIATIAAQTLDDEGARRSTRARALAGAFSIGGIPVLWPVCGVSGALWALVLGEVAFLVALRGRRTGRTWLSPSSSGA